MSHRGNLLCPAETLKRREAWKYAALKEVLAGRRFEFEYEVEGFVFDLALLDTMVLVEFDGAYHRGGQLETDVRKEEVAKGAGFMIVRREVEAATVVSPAVLDGL